MFEQHIYQGHIPENSKVGTKVMLARKVVALDPDISDQNGVKMELYGKDSDKFQLDPVNGEVFLATDPLDREEKEVYYLRLRATDSSGNVGEGLITNIQAEMESNSKSNDDENEQNEDDECETETTSTSDIEDFNRWAKHEAGKDLAHFKRLTDLIDMNEMRSNISMLNSQQRRLFDDFTERMISPDIDEKPCYLFISGNAGTGKSFLVKLLIEAVKLIKIKAGSELKKPPVIVMAPTANAAFIIGGKTIDSALGFYPMDSNSYTQAGPGKMSMMKFQYEDVHAIFCDEISMVGSMKLSKINYRLQDLADGSRKQDFMGGISFVASGD